MSNTFPSISVIAVRPGICRERHEKDFSKERSNGRHAFRNPRIEGKLGRKEEGVIVRAMLPFGQKSGGLKEKSAQLFFMLKDFFLISLSFINKYDS